jgi:hypothetical protein
MPRFVLLEHTGAPDDPTGLHYDLLLETEAACRTWRLAGIPMPGGPAVPAIELPPHRLAWLDHEAGEVSGGRGFARRIAAGSYEFAARDAADIALATRCTIVTTSSGQSRVLDFDRRGHEWFVSAATEGDPRHSGHGAAR